MAFDYDAKTKRHYKDLDVARKYHEAFTSRWGWNALRFRFIANRERRSVLSLLNRISCQTILDIPCGTGKLAEILAPRPCRIVAADISPEMLEIARDCYLAAGAKDVQFAIVDAEHLESQFGTSHFDAVICLRLLHRVPQSVRQKILDQISKASRFGIVSFGVNSRYHRVRRELRSFVYGLPLGELLCQESLEDIKRELAARFRLIETKWVAKYLSEEVVFLVESLSWANRR